MSPGLPSLQCVGSGHALLALRTDYTRQLKYIHDTLGIERVRFHGIFCDDMRTFSDLSMQMNIEGAGQHSAAQEQIALQQAYETAAVQWSGC